jgi:serine/threonine protein kinase/tetratricopeptide (TPR) repeat protein
MDHAERVSAQALLISFGPYKAIAKIGQGGMGLVYEAAHVASGERVALKTVSAVKSKALAGLRAEILALKEIHHPGVVRILDEGLAEGLPWYAMELLAGRTVAKLNEETWGQALEGEQETVSTVLALDPAAAQHVRWASPAEPRPSDPRPHLPPEKLATVLALYRRLCQPLGHIHGRGLVHRDLKPANVFIRPDGRPVLMDFGLVSRTLTGLEIGTRILGSVPYVSPEAIRGDYVDGRADLYSFGCMLYESLTGRRPFQGRSIAETLEKHLNDVPVPPSVRVRGISAGLDQLVLSLLAKRPRERVGYADELASALHELGAGDAPDDAAGSDSAPHPYRPEIVGRGAVVEDLAASRRRALNGHGSIALVGGESGIGKTYLAEEVARQALRDKFQVITGACTPVGTHLEGRELRAGPLHPFRPFLQAVADRCREGGPAMTERLLGARAGLLRHYEPALAELPGGASAPEPAVLPPEAAKLRLFDFLSETLDRFSRESPTLLVLDDIQWADELSLAFLEHLSGVIGERRLLLLGTYRAEEAGGRLDRLLTMAGIRGVQLQRLTDKDVAVMASDMLAMASPPAPLVRFLAARSEGNPFFAAEYLRFAVSEGLVSRERETWVMSASALGAGGSLESLDLPTSVRGLIERRLGGVGAPERAVVEAAAVLGKRVDDQVLAAVVGLGSGALEQSLKRLEVLHVLEAVGDGTHRFTHDRLREIIYAEIAAPRLGALHLGAVRALEASYSASEVSQHLRELAYHHRAAGQPMPALRYLERAADQALTKFANAEAAAILEQALKIVGQAPAVVDVDRRVRWERQLGDAYHGLGLMTEAQQHLSTALELLGWPIPRTKARSAVTLTAQLFEQTGRRLIGTPLDRNAAERDRYLEGARAYDRLLQIYYYTGNPLGMFLATLRTLNLAESAGPSPELAAAYSIAHAVAGIMPARGLAELYLRLAGDVLRGVPDAATESYLQLLEGVYRCGLGEWDRALAALEAGVQNANSLGFHRRSDEINLGLAYWYFFRGQLDEALGYADAIQTRGDAQAKLWRLLMRATIAVYGGRIEDAWPEVLGSVAEAETAGRAEKIWFFSVAAYLAFSAGRDDESRRYLETALTAIEAGTPVNLYCAEAYNLAAGVAIGLGERAPAGASSGASVAQRAAKALKAFARVFPVARPKALRQAGRLAMAGGREKDALRLYARSRTEARRLALPLDEEIAARALAAGGDTEPRARLAPP